MNTKVSAVGDVLRTSLDTVGECAQVLAEAKRDLENAQRILLRQVMADEHLAQQVLTVNVTRLRTILKQW